MLLETGPRPSYLHHYDQFPGIAKRQPGNKYNLIMPACSFADLYWFHNLVWLAAGTVKWNEHMLDIHPDYTPLHRTPKMKFTQKAYGEFRTLLALEGPYTGFICSPTTGSFPILDASTSAQVDNLIPLRPLRNLAGDDIQTLLTNVASHSKTEANHIKKYHKYYRDTWFIRYFSDRLRSLGHIDQLTADNLVRVSVDFTRFLDDAEHRKQR